MISRVASLATIIAGLSTVMLIGTVIQYTDPEAGFGFGYVMNKMIVPPDYFIDPRWRGLVDATYAAL